MYIGGNKNPKKNSTQSNFFLDSLAKKKKLKEILSIEMNQECFDCGRPDPEYISINNGIFICKSCVLIHYEFSEEISTIKPKLDFLTDEEILYLYKGGNNRLLNFVTLEFPGLQNYTPEILYKTRAMQYYRDRLKYYIGIRQKPSKPDDLLAYKFINDDCSNLLNRRKNTSKNSKLCKYINHKNLSKGKINSTCNINCNFNGSINNINFVNPEVYNRTINRDSLKSIVYKNNLPVQYNDNDTINKNFTSTFTLIQPKQDNSTSKEISDFTFYSTLSQKKLYKNKIKEAKNIKNYNKFIYHSPIKTNEFKKIKTNNIDINKNTKANIYQKPKRIVSNNDEVENDNKNKNKNNFPFIYSYTQRIEPKIENLKLNKAFIYKKSNDRNSIFLEKESDSFGSTTSHNLNKSQNRKYRNQNIEISDENIINNTQNIQKQKQEKCDSQIFKNIIYNKKIKSKIFPTLQSKNNNKNNQFSSLHANSNYHSTKNIAVNNEKTTFPMKIINSIQPIKINKKINGQNKKNNLFPITNSSCLYKNKTSLTKYKTKNINHNTLHSLQHNLVSSDFEFSMKAYKDKKEQECVEKEALEKLLLEGELDDKTLQLNENKENENDFISVKYYNTRIKYNDNSLEKNNIFNRSSSIRNKYKLKKADDRNREKY